MSTSQAQINANRQNAQLSTGPKTEQGKAKVSLNAVKTALTGRTILLPTDDVEKYEHLGLTFLEQYQPVGYMEELLVQSLIDTEWRLQRITAIEAGLYAIGRRDDEFAESPAEIVEAQIYLKHEKQLKNLGLQESRLRRMQQSDLKRLQTMQAERRAQAEEAKALQEAAQKAAVQAAQPKPATPAVEPPAVSVPAVPEIGFENSTSAKGAAA